MRRILPLALTVLLMTAPALAAGSDPVAPTGQLHNVSGPEFLRPYGPSGERTDNPIAAAFTAIVVAGVIYRGLKVSDNTDR